MKEIRFLRKRDPYFEFSNFYMKNIEIDGIVYPSSEHYYQSKKYEGTEWEVHVRNQNSPGDAAREGRREDLPIREDWDEVKDTVMFTVLKHKFSDPILKNLLLNTENATLIEDSKKDFYWGIGSDGTGKNKLGKMLMSLRQMFKNQERRFF